MKKLIPVFAAAVCACGTPALLSPQALSASDLDLSSVATAKKAADRLTVKSDGTVSYEQGDEPITGKFSLEPNFMLGDMNHDGKVDSQDAALLLIVSAAKNAAADGALSEVDALYGDVDEDGDVNASDSANILLYSAAKGAGQEVRPFGFAYYYADKNGGLDVTGKSNEEICEILVSVFSDSNFSVDGITGEGMTWTANGEVTKAPKAVVIKNGVYVGL